MAPSPGRLYPDILRNDFCAFLHRSFLELNPQAKFEPNWHIEVLAAKLEEVRRGTCSSTSGSIRDSAVTAAGNSSEIPAALQSSAIPTRGHSSAALIPTSMAATAENPRHCCIVSGTFCHRLARYCGSVWAGSYSGHRQ